MSGAPLVPQRVVAVPVDPEGAVAHGWGRAALVAIGVVSEGELGQWRVHEVGWDRSHDAGTEGQHHARVVRFLREHAVTDVLVFTMGTGMARTLGRMGIRVSQPDSDLAHDAAAAAVAVVSGSGG